MHYCEWASVVPDKIMDTDIPSHIGFYKSMEDEGSNQHIS